MVFGACVQTSGPPADSHLGPSAPDRAPPDPAPRGERSIEEWEELFQLFERWLGAVLRDLKRFRLLDPAPPLRPVQLDQQLSIGLAGCGRSKPSGLGKPIAPLRRVTWHRVENTHVIRKPFVHLRLVAVVHVDLLLDDVIDGHRDVRNEGRGFREPVRHVDENGILREGGTEATMFGTVTM